MASLHEQTKKVKDSLREAVTKLSRNTSPESQTCSQPQRQALDLRLLSSWGQGFGKSGIRVTPRPRR